MRQLTMDHGPWTKSPLTWRWMTGSRIVINPIAFFVIAGKRGAGAGRGTLPCPGLTRPSKVFLIIFWAHALAFAQMGR